MDGSSEFGEMRMGEICGCRLKDRKLKYIKMIEFFTSNYMSIIITLGSIFAIYVLFSLFGPRHVLKSEIVSKENLITTKGIINADMVYYLPTANLQLKATVKVIVIKDSTTNIIDSAYLSELSIENVVAIIPDSDFLFALNYSGSWFMNDELKLNVDANGLLQSISTTTEDRFSNIVSEIAESPSKIFTLKSALLQSDLNNKYAATQVYTKDFNVLSKEIESKSVQRSWKINIDGAINKEISVDASIKIDFLFSSDDKKADLQKEMNGLLSRPLVKVDSNISLICDPNVIAKTEINIPDRSRVINVSVKRSPFIKRTNSTKFTTGILTENYISKPSEFEGFISIPINFGKALVSIPAALFNFQIQHKNQKKIAEMDMQKKIDELKKQIQTLEGTPAK